MSLAQSPDRQFRTLSDSQKIINLADSNIFEPYLFAARNANYFAVYDYSRNSLIAYRNGDFKVLASGIGGGPGEFQNPTGLKIAPNGNIWIADPVQARISTWSPEGALLRTIRHDQQVPENIAVNSNRYIVKKRRYSASDGLFNAYSLKDKPINSFGALEKSLVGSIFYHEGSVYADNNALYFAGQNSGFLKKYALKGKQVYSTKTVEKVATIEMVKQNVDADNFENIEEITARKPSESANTASLDITGTEQYLYVLFSGTTDGMAHYIDTYRKSDGQYLWSYQLKRDVYDIGVTANSLMMLYREKNGSAFKIAIISRTEDD